MASIAPVFTWRTAITEPDSPLSANGRYIGLVLSLYFNSKTGTAFPRHEVLARDAALSIRTVKRGLAELQRCGYVWIEQRKGQSNLYHASLPSVMLARMAERYGQPQAGESDTHDSPPDGGQATGGLSSQAMGGPQKLVVEVEEPATEKKKGGGEHRLIFGALCEMMGRPPQGGEGAVWGRVAKLMAQELVPPDEVVRRGALMKARWSTIPPSPMALWNNWGQFAEGAGAESPYEARRRAEQEMHEEAEAIRKEWADADARGSGEGPGGGA